MQISVSFLLNKCDQKLVEGGINKVPKCLPPGRAYRQLGEWTVQSRDKQKPPQRCRPGPGFRTTELPLGLAFPEEITSPSQSSGSERIERFNHNCFFFLPEGCPAPCGSQLMEPSSHQDACTMCAAWWWICLIFFSVCYILFFVCLFA